MDAPSSAATRSTGWLRAEDWDAIQCPVYAVGGWTDGYTNAVFRLLAIVKSPSKGAGGTLGA